ncbi:MAG: hypothetical protein P0S95_03285 [Rhabdochlamydiaceae bacterium]|nr:hypothetical protein [Candidatus Amphrikana amoebophyrae]
MSTASGYSTHLALDVYAQFKECEMRHRTPMRSLGLHEGELTTRVSAQVTTTPHSSLKEPLYPQRVTVLELDDSDDEPDLDEPADDFDARAVATRASYTWADAEQMLRNQTHQLRALDELPPLLPPATQARCEREAEYRYRAAHQRIDDEPAAQPRLDAPPPPIALAPMTYRQRAQLARAQLRATAHEFAFQRREARAGRADPQYARAATRAVDVFEGVATTALALTMETRTSFDNLWGPGYLSQFLDEGRKEVGKQLGVYNGDVGEDITYCEGATFILAQYIFLSASNLIGVDNALVMSLINSPTIKRMIIKNPHFQELMRMGERGLKRVAKKMAISIPKSIVKGMINEKIRSGMLGILHDVIVKKVPTEVTLRSLSHNLELYTRSIKSQLGSVSNQANGLLTQAGNLLTEVNKLKDSIKAGEGADPKKAAKALRNLVSRYEKLTKTSASTLFGDVTEALTSGRTAITPLDELAAPNFLIQIVAELELMNLAPILSNITAVLESRPSLARLGIAVIGGSLSTISGHTFIGGIATWVIANMVSYDLDDATNIKRYPKLYLVCQKIQSDFQQALHEISRDMNGSGYTQTQITNIGAIALEVVVATGLQMVKDPWAPLVDLVVNPRIYGSLARSANKLGFASNAATARATESLGISVIPFQVVSGVTLQGLKLVLPGEASLAVDVVTIICSLTCVKRWVRDHPRYQTIKNNFEEGIPLRKTRQHFQQMQKDFRMLERRLPKRFQLMSKTSKWIKVSLSVASVLAVSSEARRLAIEYNAIPKAKWIVTLGASVYGSTVVSNWFVLFSPSWAAAAAQWLTPEFEFFAGYTTRIGPKHQPISDKMTRVNLVSAVASSTVAIVAQVYIDNLFVTATLRVATVAIIKSDVVRNGAQQVLDRAKTASRRVNYERLQCQRRSARGGARCARVTRQTGNRTWRMLTSAWGWVKEQAAITKEIFEEAVDERVLG